MEAAVRGARCQGMAASPARAQRGNSKDQDSPSQQVPLTKASSYSKRHCGKQQLRESTELLTRAPLVGMSGVCQVKSWGLSVKQPRCCARASENGSDVTEGLGGNVDFQEELDKVMQQGDAPRLMEKLQTAENRVLRAEAARKVLEEKLEEVAHMKEELARASEDADMEEADEGVTAAARLVAKAEAEVELRRLEVLRARASQGGKWSTPGVDEDKERTESGKAAAISAAAGLVASLPVALAGQGPDSSLLSLVVSEGALLVTCVLFGVCYRYMIRRDVLNTQLKGGVVGAFGLTRGLAQVSTSLQLSSSSPAAFQTLLTAALEAGESVIFLAFAAAALDFCMKSGRLQPFPSIDVSETDESS